MGSLIRKTASTSAKSIEKNATPNVTDLKTSKSDEVTLKAEGYNLVKFIGEGAYAKVFLTEYISESKGDSVKRQLACKIIETKDAPCELVTKFLPREIAVLIRLDHPHVVHIHSIFQRKSKYFIFMRYAEHGDVLHHILKHGCVTENQARVWIHQASLGVQYLHEMEITHRDLKCENILLTGNYNVKLSDFGFARYCIDELSNPIVSETYCGSMSYAAPEILRGKPYHPKPSDIWSLGVVLFVMLNKAMPFDDTRMKKLYEQQMSRRYKFKARVANTVSTECKNLVKSMLEPDTVLRCNAAQVVRSGWIAMDNRLVALNAAEEASLKKAREERKRLFDKRHEKEEYIKNPSDLKIQKNHTDELNLVNLSPSEQSALHSRGYRLIKKLNEGSYAKVYLAEYSKPDKGSKPVQLACKVIDTKTASKDYVKKFLPREIDVLIKINHPHLVHTHSIFLRRYKYFIFMRLMEKGDLLEYILSHGVIKEDQARIWTRQISLAIQYLHELEIAHRDIKCENILLTANLNVKLSDFGFARSCVDARFNPIFSETFCGSLSYTAPEILQGSPYEPKPTDIWSVGVVVYVMLNRTMPFEDDSVKRLLTAQLTSKWKFRSKVDSSVSENCKRLVHEMLTPNPMTRIEVEGIISSEWFAMDSRLLEYTPQEQQALKKAQETKQNQIKKAAGASKKYVAFSHEKLPTENTEIAASSNVWSPDQ